MNGIRSEHNVGDRRGDSSVGPEKIGVCGWSKRKWTASAPAEIVSPEMTILPQAPSFFYAPKVFIGRPSLVALKPVRE